MRSWFMSLMVWLIEMFLDIFKKPAVVKMACNNEGAVTVPFTPAAAPKEPQRKPTSGWWRVLKKSRHHRPYPA